MKLTFLSACDGYPLTKTYTKEADGTLSSRPYPNTLNFTSHVEHVTTIEQFYDKLVAHAAEGHCLLKGNLTKDLKCARRAGLVSPEQTSFVCLDFDGLDLGPNSEGREIEALEELLVQFGLAEVDYILQYSSTQGIKPGLRAHVFFLLAEPQAPEMLKRWLMDLNLSVPAMSRQLQLTETKMAIHWTLDITTCQNDKLLYIAPPQLIGFDDPLDGNRIILVKKKLIAARVTGPTRDVESAGRELRRTLRRAAGCEDKEYKFRIDKETGYEVLANPDQMAITGMRTARGWTYLNINGSTSWGYFHRTDKPEVIGNFRGEPYYYTKDINPDYYREALERAKQAKRDTHTPGDDSQPLRWVINDKSDGRYYKVTYIPGFGITLDPAPTVKHIQDFCLLHNISAPEAVPDWEVRFDPTNLKPFDSEERWVNLYTPTAYRVETLRKYPPDVAERERANPANKHIPLPYYRLIKHACGSDNQATEYLINWLAFIWQTGKKTKTAWVLHGTYGTGKGRLLRVLKHLFGKHAVMTTAEQVNEMFNANMKTALILWIDEVTTDSWDNDKVTPKLRQWIDGEEIPLREMRKDWNSNLRNYMNILVAANEHNPVEIRLHDRRWNVAPRQEVKLKYLDWAVPEVLDDDIGSLYAPENLQELADALFLYPVDIGKVREPMENEAKLAVMQVTQSLPQDVVNALLSGNAGFFVDFVSAPSPTSNVDALDSSAYRKIVARMMEGGRIALRTTDLAHLFKVVAGWNQSPGKFVKAASKFGLQLGGSRVRLDGKVVAGAHFTFFPSEEDKAMWAALNPVPLAAVKEAS